VTRYLPVKKRETLIKEVVEKICQEEGVGEKELLLGGQVRRVSSVRAKVAWQLSREYGIPMAEIARHVGVCTSAIANAIRKIEMENMK
jgi:putative transposase